MNFIAQLANGLGSGSIYALIALGYSMVYGVVKLINFAHGDIIMVGGYGIFIVLSILKLPVPIAMIASIFSCIAIGYLVQKIAYQPLLKKQTPKIAILITAIGISMFLQNLYQLIFGQRERSIPSMIPLPSIDIAGVTIDTKTFLNIGVSIVCAFILTLLVNRTKMGKAMRATSEDPGAAQLMGIDSNKIIAFTFVVGSALAGIGAILYTNKFPSVEPMMGSMLGLKAFISAVLGGIGNLYGAMLGGFLIGIIESLSKAYMPEAYTNLSDAVVFLVLIIILLFKPSGLLGKQIQEKV